MNPSDQQPRFCAAAKWIFRAGALTLLLALPAFAQNTANTPKTPPAPPAAPAAGAPDLRAAITQKYEVLAVSNGVVLKPRTEELGVRAIEVSGDTIAVNGERVSEGVLRAWLGEQAEPVVRLHRLPPAGRQALFGLKQGTGETEIPDTSTGEKADASETAEKAETAETAEKADGDTPEPEETPEVGETPAAPAAPEIPEVPSTSSGSRVKIAGGITIDKDEMAEEAVAVLGSVRVDGQVAQNVVAVGGSVIVNGKVGGDVVSVGGSVHLGRHAEVMGDVTSVGGTIDREEGSKVHGSTQDVGVAGGRDWHRDVDVDTGLNPFGALGLLWSLIWLIVLALLIFLTLLLGRRRVERAEAYVATEPWKAAVVGILAVFLSLPLLAVVTVLLMITLIGCALILLYPFFAVVLVLLLLVGYTASVHRLGVLLERRFDRRFGSPYAVALMGLLVLHLWIILGNLLGLIGGFLHVIGVLLVIFGFAAHVAAFVIGLGAIILDRLNGPAAAATLPTLPPAPLVPPAQPMPPRSPTSAAALPLSEQWEEDERRWEEEREDRRGEEPPPPEG
jgi:hypothetical protein